MNWIKKIVNEKIVCSLILFVIMLISVFAAYDYKEQLEEFENTHPYSLLTPEGFQQGANRVKDLRQQNGLLTATSNECFLVIGDRAILDNRLRTITINVKNVSEENIPAKLYVLNSYERYDFVLHKGRCNITLKPQAELNNGAVPALLRLDLLNAQGQSVELADIAFNDPAVFKDVILSEGKNGISKLMVAFTLILLFIYLLRLGIIHLAPGRTTALMAIIALVAGIGLHIPAKGSMLPFALFTLGVIWALWVVYYLFTAFIIEKIRLKTSVSTTAVIIFALLLLCLHKNTVLFLFLMPYPVYLFGWYYTRINPEQRFKLLTPVIAVLSTVFLTVLATKGGTILNCLQQLNGSAVRAYIMAVTLFGYISALFIVLSFDVSTFVRDGTSKAAHWLLPFTSAFVICAVLGIDVSFAEAIICLLLVFALAIVFDRTMPLNGKPYSADNACLNTALVPQAMKFVLMQIIFVLLVLFFEYMTKNMLMGMEDEAIRQHLNEYLFTSVFAYNLLLVNVLYLLCTCVLGVGLGELLFGIINLLLFIANFVKLKYHNAMFKPGDFLQIGDFWNIFEGALRARHIIFAVVVLMLVVFVLFRLRKRLIPKFNIVLIVFSVATAYGVGTHIANNGLTDIGITTVDKWLDDELRTQRQGFYIFSYLNALTIKDLIPQTPENYSYERMYELKQQFEELPSTEIDGIKPDVIMLMQESVFDLEALPDVTFNISLEENIKKYKSADMISPRYGGGTANVEFEALTGLSTYFVADNVVPYVTYWSSENSYIPSVAHQFKNNGYQTLAIHPNSAAFYNRDIIYPAMGFDDFISIEDMKPDIRRNRRGYVYNNETLEVMFNALKQSDQPKFMFALNIENHNPYDIKEADNKVIATGNMTEEEKNELEVYGNTLISDDEMIAKVIDYMNNTDRPTLLYVWGDHLPGLKYFSSSGFIADKENKYKTPVVMYSNYKQVGTDVKMFTPNQLAPQVLMDSGIEYDSYFDYIFSLRQSYPVMHKEFDVDINDEKIKIYQMLQYDLLFGEGYYFNN